MPIFGRYLLKNYLKIFFLSVLSFIAILLVSRLEDISGFAAMGAKSSYLLRFTLYQIPYILQIAIPISCLISGMLLFQRLSHTHELTALRAGGISLKNIAVPILIAGAFIGCGTLYISSELATASHLATRKMVYDITSVNPIILLQSAKIAKLQDAFVQMDPIKSGEAAKDLVIAFRNQARNGRINLCLVKQVEMRNRALVAENVSLVSSLPTSSGENGVFEHLIIENQKLMSSSAPELAQLLQKGGWKISNDHLKLSLLRIRSKQLSEKIAIGGANAKTIRNYKKCHSEMIRRSSLGVASFTFTLMGIAFGMEISRNRTKKGILSVLFLTAFCLIAFFVGKEFDHLVWVAALLFLFPHIIITGASVWTLRRISRGIE